MSRNEEGDVTNYLVMAKTKTEENAADKPKMEISVSEYPFKFVAKNFNKKSLEGKFQKKIQTAVSGLEHTVAAESGKLLHRKHISGPIVFRIVFRRRNGIRKSGTRSHQKSTLPPRPGKYNQWNEILRDILNGILKRIQNRTRKSESESESVEGEIDEESDSSKWKIQTHPKETGISQSAQTPTTN